MTPTRQRQRNKAHTVSAHRPGSLNTFRRGQRF